MTTRCWLTWIITAQVALSLHHTYEFEEFEPESAVEDVEMKLKVSALNRELLPAFALRPGDDAGATIAQLARIASQKLDFTIPDEVQQQLLAEYWQHLKLSEKTSLLLSTSNKGLEPSAASAVPFTWHRMGGPPGALVEHLRLSIVNARWGVSRLLSKPQVLTIEGMSDDRVRHLLNNICMAHGTRFIEVGSWRGSTMASALAGNEAAVDLAVAVDSWEDSRADSMLFGSGVVSMQAFVENVNSAAQSTDGRSLVNVVWKDFRALTGADWAKVETDKGIAEARFNVYLFDGPHEREDHFDALALMLPRLTRTFVYLVDDWNYEPVQQGTFEAYAALGLRVVYDEVAGGGRLNGVAGPWHNGFYVAVLEKNQGA
eukprot:CAMPEP_0172606108 /NCGR_PEP_ID=MMETSP1068-20121228/26292_1 /TAXON_ID=35684 /ORGANISM="Pseudopedinella elastica, Strain CCMP716" /LENGTH=372 /DNA_ID=CAMNT_0013408711 /DNA_START=148 /DNA_END=1266 /DNA_ORIENTATION=-